MTTPEIKSEIVKHLIKHLNDEKTFLEKSEKLAIFYDESQYQKTQVIKAFDELYAELIKKYKVNNK